MSSDSAIKLRNILRFLLTKSVRRCTVLLVSIALAFIWLSLVHKIDSTPTTEISRSESKQTRPQEQGVDVMNNVPISPTNGSSDTQTVYVITPTYGRSTQYPDMTRMSQTLLHVRNLHWIVIEDSTNTNPWISNLLERIQIQHTYLACESTRQTIVGHVRGAIQRNCGLSWLLENNIHNGVIYFADDDNAYDFRLFDEIRSTRQVSLMPVGLRGMLGVSTPVVQNNVIVGFITSLKDKRKFQVDMASIAVNVDFWVSRGSPKFQFRRGRKETVFLQDLHITLADIEAKAYNSTQVLVWHTRTQEAPCSIQNWNNTKYEDTNIPALLDQISGICIKITKN